MIVKQGLFKQQAKLAVQLANEAPPKMPTIYLLLTNADRIKDIDNKLALGEHKLDNFERSVLDTMRTQRFGTSKQQEVLNRIEVKLFGHARDKEAKKK